MMRHNHSIKIVCFLLVLLSSTVVVAQKKSDTTITKVAKFKPPVLKTFLGGYTADSARKISVDEGKNIIGLFLRVTDKAGIKYTITHYGFAYTRIGVTENEQTGDVTPETDVIADDFTTTPLSGIWVKNIKDGLQKGEQLHFYDVIVKDAKGRIIRAPELTFVIQ
jgi:hypothetical protein